MSNLPISAHAHWCDPARCETDGRTFIEHRSAPDQLETLDAEITTSRVALFSPDGGEEFDLARFVVNMSGVDSMAECLLDALELRQLAATLLRHADALDGGQ